MQMFFFVFCFFFSSRRRHTRYIGDWSSDVCSSDLGKFATAVQAPAALSFVWAFVGGLVEVLVEAYFAQAKNGCYLTARFLQYLQPTDERLKDRKSVV